MPEIITPAEALHKSIADLLESSECSLFEAIGVLEVIKSQTTLVSLADEIEAEGEFESDGVVGE